MKLIDSSTLDGRFLFCWTNKKENGGDAVLFEEVSHIFPLHHRKFSEFRKIQLSERL